MGMVCTVWCSGVLLWENMRVKSPCVCDVGRYVPVQCACTRGRRLWYIMHAPLITWHHLSLSYEHTPCLQVIHVGLEFQLSLPPMISQWPWRLRNDVVGRSIHCVPVSIWWHTRILPGYPKEFNSMNTPSVKLPYLYSFWLLPMRLVGLGLIYSTHTLLASKFDTWSITWKERDRISCFDRGGASRRAWGWGLYFD